MINYHIGEGYKYERDNKIFKLKEVSGYLFLFECGHWCSDTIFINLIRVKTGRPVNEDLQMELFKN